MASAGKLGVHVLENLKVNNVPKNIREETQPLERKWPFPGEGKEVPQEDGPTPKLLCFRLHDPHVALMA